MIWILSVAILDPNLSITEKTYDKNKMLNNVSQKNTHLLYASYSYPYQTKHNLTNDNSW